MDNNTISSRRNTYFDVCIDCDCDCGSSNNDSPGNRLYDRLIAHNQGQYRTETSNNRKYLVQSIVTAIHMQGGRFVDRDDNEVTHEQASLVTVQELENDDSMDDEIIDTDDEMESDMEDEIIESPATTSLESASNTFSKPSIDYGAEPSGNDSRRSYLAMQGSLSSVPSGTTGHSLQNDTDPVPATE